MRISRVGGIIATVNKKDTLPMLQVGSISIIKRIVISFQQAGIFPIVVVIGAGDEEIKYQLSGHNVIFICNEQPEQLELIDAAKIGLRYLQGKCDRIIFAPVNTPMFTPDTLLRLINASGEIVTPSIRKHGGHPVLLSAAVIPQILSYEGRNGLRGALQELSERRVWVTVEDQGVLTSA